MKYNAFISYSHAADGTLAPALQTALRRFARPWYKRRALRVFRDKTSLGATPELWPTIERALDDSEYFLLLASPEAAQSPWVEREVEWWFAHRSFESMFILLTDGEVVWDGTAGDYDWEATDALGSYLQGRFKNEPLYVDLRTTKTQDTLALRHSQFRAAVLDIAAPLHGVDKDELDGEDVRQHRRTKAIAAFVVAIIVVLGVWAEVQRQNAVEERDNAQETLSRLQVANGLQHFEDDDHLGSLVWFAEVLERDYAHSQRAKMHRMRLGAFLRHTPKLMHIWFHDAPVNYAAFDPSGQRVAAATGYTYRRAASGGAAHVWDTVTGKAFIPPLRHSETVYAVEFSPNQRWFVTASGDGMARFWDAQTGKPVGQIHEDHNTTVRRAVFNPDGSRVATLSAKGARVWEVSSGEPVTPWLKRRSEYSRFWHIAFNADGTYVVTTEGSSEAGGYLQVWDVGERYVSPPMYQRGERIYASFSPDGRRLVSGSNDGTVMLWNPQTGKRVGEIITQSSAVFHASFSPDGGHVLTTNGDGMVHLYGGDFEEGTWTKPVVIDHGSAVRQAAFAPDSRRVVTSGIQGMARVWDVKTGEPLTPALPHSHSLYSKASAGQQSISVTGYGTPPAEYYVLFDDSDGRRLVTTGWDGTVRLWDVGTRALSEEPYPVSEEKDHRVEIRGKQVWVLDARKGALAVGPLGHRYDIISADLLPDGRYLITVSGDPDKEMGEVRLWDLTTKHHLIVPATPEIKHAGFTPQGTQVVTVSRVRSPGDSEVGGRSGVQFWDVETGLMVPPLIIPEGGAERVFFSPGGSRIATTGGEDGRTVQIWATASGKQLSQPMRHQCRVVSVIFSPDTHRVAIVSTDPTVRVWDLRDGKSVSPPLWPELGPTKACPQQTQLAGSFSPDGRRLATSGLDNAVRVWEVETGHPVTPPLNHPTAVRGARFSEGGKQLLTRSAGKQWAWDLSADERSADCLAQLTNVLAARRLDGSGSLVFLSRLEFEDKWKKLKAECPGIIGAPIAAQPCSHQQREACSNRELDGARTVDDKAPHE